MSDQTSDTEEKNKSFKGEWATGAEGKAAGILFTPEELDIYVNKMTLEAYIFHGKEIDYELLDRLEYNTKKHTVEVVKKDGTRLDLGVKIQWLVRPYFKKAEEINIVQTKDGKSIDGVTLPIVHKKK